MKKLREKMSLQIRFFLLCMLEFIAVAVLADAAGWLLKRWLGITPEMPIFLWAVLFSIVFGGAITKYVTATFFDPITKLGKAMEAVSAGDFRISVETNSKISEIQALYDNFNRMVRELGSTEMLQTDFISNVSHEFKTPINAIEGYAALLQEQDLTPEEQRQYQEKILFNTRRLSTLAGNILLLSKLSNQSILPKSTTYRLDEQIRQAVVALEQKWEEKDIELDIDLERTSFTGYESLMMHVWSNLIDNAVKFDPQGGLVRMRLHSTGDEIIFCIEDSGSGIVPGEEERIFTKFYQSDTSRKSEGNGLGLPLVKKITELNGGTVTAENLPQGGCRFTVRLPAAAPQQ